MPCGRQMQLSFLISASSWEIRLQFPCCRCSSKERERERQAKNRQANRADYDLAGIFRVHFPSLSLSSLPKVGANDSVSCLIFDSHYFSHSIPRCFVFSLALSPFPLSLDGLFSFRRMRLTRCFSLPACIVFDIALSNLALALSLTHIHVADSFPPPSLARLNSA